MAKETSTSSTTRSLENAIPYTPISSLGRELGVMFGFMGLCIVSVLVYVVFWQFSQRRIAAKEAARREAFTARSRAAYDTAAEKAKANSFGNDTFDGDVGLEGSRKVNRNGSSSGGLGFGDREEDLIV